MKTSISLFLTGFLQVVLVSINTWQIANKKYMGALIIGFLISFVWSFNVKKIAFGSMVDRISYASGAMCGTVSGILIASLIYG